MGRGVWLVLAAVLLLVLVSGCAVRPNGAQNATERNTTYVYGNVSNLSGNATGNESIAIDITSDFTFMVYGDTEFWMKENDTANFTMVFNNLDEYMGNHTYIARVFPSAVNFDVMAAYQCLHFTTCDALLSDMHLMLEQPETPVEINYTRIGLYQIGIRIPQNKSSGMYMYNAVACRDLAFSECNQTTTNFGPNIAIIVHVLERE
jgi:hypothetical protein